MRSSRPSLAADLSVIKLVRAAIYCRVSSDESLRLEFNSLHAQREACEAYIKSQQHEGWELVSTDYDDGGFSGGSLNRPALKRLLDDVAGDKIDVIVVYKIDRLTRALTDFARIVDVLDKANTSFVSITQSFSTTTSMGRLTLNVLLSFAQFEREVGAERVRDKIAASKKKGMWMGGVCPLGYDPKDRKLVINEPEADTVRHIFNRYLEVGSVLILEEELNRQGTRSKLRVSSAGVTSGGGRFARGALYTLLKNQIYVGKICHRGAAYSGQHDAIIDDATFEKAQALFAMNRTRSGLLPKNDQVALLTGLVWDAESRRLSPTHSKKGAARYRYYATKPDRSDQRPPTRVAAAELEKVVRDRLADLLNDRGAIQGMVAPWAPDAVSLEAILFTAKQLVSRLTEERRTDARDIIRTLVRRIDVLKNEVHISLRPATLLELAALPSEEVKDSKHVEVVVPVRMFRRAREMRLAIAPGASPDDPAKDPALVKLITKAWQARMMLFKGEGSSLRQVAVANGYEPHYFAVLVKLGFLAPDLLAAVLKGEQPQQLTRQKLARIRKLPISWNDQRTLLCASE
jgi:DNA invertase Pin-like site-specific DNA recombinase